MAERILPGLQQLAETERQIRQTYAIPRNEGIRTIDELKADARQNGGRYIEPEQMKPFIPSDMHRILEGVEHVLIDASGNVGYKPKPKQA